MKWYLYGCVRKAALSAIVAVKQGLAVAYVSVSKRLNDLGTYVRASGGRSMYLLQFPVENFNYIAFIYLLHA